MKTHYTLIILLSLLYTLSSCKKDRLEQMEKSLVGCWEIREETGGGLSFGEPSNLAPGNGRIMQFTEKTYAYIDGTSVLYSGTYTVDVKVSGGKREYILNFINNGSPRFFKINDNKLTIYPFPGLQDASTQIYERVKDPVLQTN
jgi:hypothetical protein